jgi:hypothetical protein
MNETLVLTILLGAVCGGLGAALAVLIWMKAKKLKEIEGGPAVSTTAPAIKGRVQYYGIAALAGIFMGAILAFFGYHGKIGELVIAGAAFGVGLSPGIFKVLVKFTTGAP